MFTPPPFILSTAVPVSAFVTLVENVANQAVYTYSDVPIGTAHADRMTAVGVHWHGSSASAITSVEIDTGSGYGAMTEVHVTTNSGSGVGLYRAATPTGTTANIRVTMPASISRNAISVWEVHGLASHAPHDSTHSGGGVELSLTVPANGFIISLCQCDNNESPSWSGGPTQRYDSYLESAKRITGADGVSVSSGTWGIPMPFSSVNLSRHLAASWG